MGKLTYDSTNIIDFEDRLLAHLQIVIGQKIRADQSFYFSWKNDPAAGGGRCTIWINPTMPLHFRYNARQIPPINPEWIRVLARSANTSTGLEILPEPADSEASQRPIQTGRVSPIATTRHR